MARINRTGRTAPARTAATEVGSGKTPRSLVIVGAGLAGAKAGEAVRASGFDGRIVLIGDEPHPPYERPPLSKAVLRGEAPAAATMVHDADFYDDNGIDLVTGCRVEALDVADRRVRLADGRHIRFDTAVLATGASPRPLDVPGSRLAGVHYLRTIDDAARLADAIRQASRVAVIGGGWIGTEVAASARQMGADVVLIHPQPVPLQRVLGRQLGQVLRELHADHGVRYRHGAVAALRGGSAVEEVVLYGGRAEPADLVVVGIGVAPNAELAGNAGLAVANGVVTDEQLRTSAPEILAAGDVANAFHPAYRRHLRVQHWANALHQGGMAGRNATGAVETYDRLPYFFSDQYDLGLEYVGHGDADDTVVIRGNPEDRKFIAFWLRNQRVVAAMNVNVWDVVDDLRAIVEGHRPADRNRLADPGIPLIDLA
jgi:3-phenylpropionate/trans-cinnamate dioxygenase ferredoxin reductase subunit